MCVQVFAWCIGVQGREFSNRIREGDEYVLALEISLVYLYVLQLTSVTWPVILRRQWRTYVVCVGE